MKAQVSGQVFVFIFALIVASAIIVFGYKGVSLVLGKAEEAKVASLINQIEGHVAEAKSYGSVKQDITYSLPKGYKFICFADPGSTQASREAAVTAANTQGKPLIAQAIKKGEQKNIFLGPNDFRSFYVKNLNVNSNTAPKCTTQVCCFDASPVKVTYFGCGDRTMISTAITTATVNYENFDFRAACG
ncbi:hypothetical protein HYY74_06660 [Candidatus Woesearchaeota archaeon]|nr:hypothetical protein [Candidatus Woesearchaeota archaeon]